MTVSATDATSGVAGLGYTVNGGGLNLYLSPVSFNVDGVYNIQLIGLDNAQNSTTDSIQIQFDSTAPQMSINLVGDKGQNDWFISQPAFVVTASDTTSDVGSIGYNIENSGWNPYTNPVKITREGLYSISVEVRDNATNSTSHTFQIGYDITPPQTSATLTETEDGMTITLNRWDGVSGYALTRVAINGVWQDYHAPITISEKGEYWVQYFTTDFAGNIEAEKITSFTIAETGVVITQNPPVVNIIPPSNPPNTPPFETADDFPPNLGDETILYVSHPPPPVIISTPPTFSDDNRASNNGDGVHTTNTNIGVHGDPPRISRPPFIRENTETTRLSDVFPLEAHFPPADNPPRLSRLPVIREEIHELGNLTPDSHQTGKTNDGIRRTPTIIREGDFALESHPPRVRTNPVPLEYVEHPVAFVPTENAIISNPPTGTSVPENAPLDVTMIAVLGLTMAGAGLMKSESARKKQDELAKAEAVAQANLITALAEQKDSAEDNWAENQTMQANAQQSVMTEVTQSDANRQFWADYAIWEQRVAEAEAKRQAEQHQTATSGMFPPGSTIEDLPPHLQKLFWELGNMHFEKNEGGDWRFADDRGELGYHQYLIRQALKNGDNEALTAHFQSANQWIDKSLINWVDRELETVTQTALVTTRQKQQDAFRSVSPDKFDGKYTNASQKYLANVENKLLNVTREAIETTQVAVDRKSKELKTDLVNRDREHLVGHVDESATKAMTTFTTGVLNHQQQLVTQAKQVAVQLTPPPPPNRNTSGNVKFNQTPPNRMDENTDEDDSEEFVFPEYPDGIHSDEEMRQMFINAHTEALLSAYASAIMYALGLENEDDFNEMVNRAISIYRVGHPYFLSENDITTFGNLLGSIANFGGILYPLSARMMRHYLGATGNPLFIDPRYLLLQVADPTDYSEFVGEILKQYDEDLLKSLEFDINGGVVTLENIKWRTSMRFRGGDAFYAIGAMNITSTDGILTISYTINPDTLSGLITVRQNVEMYDQYDWDAEKIFFNPTTGMVMTMPHYFSENFTSPPLHINPATNAVYALADQEENYIDYDIEALYLKAVEKGYLPISNPPDEWNFAALQLPTTPIIAGQELTTVPGVNFFGLPANDHTNPFYERDLQILGGDSHFSAGQFHQLESNGGAKPFTIFTNMDITMQYQVQLENQDGTLIPIQIQQVNQPVIESTVPLPITLTTLTTNIPPSISEYGMTVPIIIPEDIIFVEQPVFDLIEHPNYQPNPPSDE